LNEKNIDEKHQKEVEMELSKDLLLKFYKDMVRIRKADERMLECLFAGKILTFYHSGQGQEAPGVGLCAALREDDYLYYSHRSHGINKLFPLGMSPKLFFAEHMGKATGGSRGFAGWHSPYLERGVFGEMGIVGGELTVAVGTALACQLNEKGQVVACCFGDGATGRGSFHEGMLMAAKWKLPIIWFCENNLYGQWTGVAVTHPRPDIAHFAHPYDIPSAIVDGQDVVAVYEAVQPAIERARKGEGPTLLEVKTYRYRMHSEGGRDASSGTLDGLRPKEEIEAWKKRDPIKLFEEKLLTKKILTKTNIERIEREIQEEVEAAVRFAEESPYPDPKDMDKYLYAE
jgi:pyruvate dehydrogenase E1 component alpha subunit